MPLTEKDIKRQSNGKPVSNMVKVVGSDVPRLVDIDDIDGMVERGEIEEILYDEDGDSEGKLGEPREVVTPEVTRATYAGGGESKVEPPPVDVTVPGPVRVEVKGGVPTDGGKEAAAD
ncbi:MAG: hypothetical protein ABSG46_20250 [Candidatus Binataceae bacterium]